MEKCRKGRGGESKDPTAWLKMLTGRCSKLEPSQSARKSGNGGKWSQHKPLHKATRCKRPAERRLAGASHVASSFLFSWRDHGAESRVRSCWGKQFLIVCFYRKILNDWMMGCQVTVSKPQSWLLKCGIKPKSVSILLQFANNFNLYLLPSDTSFVPMLRKSLNPNSFLLLLLILTIVLFPPSLFFTLFWRW